MTPTILKHLDDCICEHIRFQHKGDTGNCMICNCEGFKKK